MKTNAVRVRVKVQRRISSAAAFGDALLGIVIVGCGMLGWFAVLWMIGGGR